MNGEGVKLVIGRQDCRECGCWTVLGALLLCRYSRGVKDRVGFNVSSLYNIQSIQEMSDT